MITRRRRRWCVNRGFPATDLDCRLSTADSLSPLPPRQQAVHFPRPPCHSSSANHAAAIHMPHRKSRFFGMLADLSNCMTYHGETKERLDFREADQPHLRKTCQRAARQAEERKHSTDRSFPTSEPEPMIRLASCRPPILLIVKRRPVLWSAQASTWIAGREIRICGPFISSAKSCVAQVHNDPPQPRHEYIRRALSVRMLPNCGKQ